MFCSHMGLSCCTLSCSSLNIKVIMLGHNILLLFTHLMRLGYAIKVKVNVKLNLIRQADGEHSTEKHYFLCVFREPVRVQTTDSDPIQILLELTISLKPKCHNAAVSRHFLEVVKLNHEP